MIGKINCSILNEVIAEAYTNWKDEDESRIVTRIITDLTEGGYVDDAWNHLIYSENGEYDEEADQSVFDQLTQHITNYIKNI